MQLYRIGRKFHLNSINQLAKIFLSKLSIELFSLFSFVFIEQQFLNKNSLAIHIFILWIILVYFAYKLRSHFNSKFFIKKLNLQLDEIIDIFDQLPNSTIFENLLFLNNQNSIEWLNYLLSSLWSNFNFYFDKKFKNFTFNLNRFLTLENFSIGLNSPIIEKFNSSLIINENEDTLILDFDLYWFAQSIGKKG